MEMHDNYSAIVSVRTSVVVSVRTSVVVSVNVHSVYTVQVMCVQACSITVKYYIHFSYL